MKSEKSYFADSSFLIDLTKEHREALDIIENSQLILTSVLCIYEIARLSDIEPSKVSENRIEGLELGDVDEASKIYQELREKGEMVNQIDILIAAQARRKNLRILTADRDFEKIDGVETLYYRD